MRHDVIGLVRRCREALLVTRAHHRLLASRTHPTERVLHPEGRALFLPRSGIAASPLSTSMSLLLPRVSRAASADHQGVTLRMRTGTERGSGHQRFCTKTVKDRSSVTTGSLFVVT